MPKRKWRNLNKPTTCENVLITARNNDFSVSWREIWPLHTLRTMVGGGGRWWRLDGRGLGHRVTDLASQRWLWFDRRQENEPTGKEKEKKRKKKKNNRRKRQNNALHFCVYFIYPFFRGPTIQPFPLSVSYLISFLINSLKCSRAGFNYTFSNEFCSAIWEIVNARNRSPPFDVWLMAVLSVGFVRLALFFCCLLVFDAPRTTLSFCEQPTKDFKWIWNRRKEIMHDNVLFDSQFQCIHLVLCCQVSN